MKFHYPKAHGPDPDRFVEFSTMEEFSAIDELVWWFNRKGFHRISLGDDGHVMAELNDGYEWWVIGYLRDIDLLFTTQLPAWEPRYTQENLDEQKRQAEAQQARSREWWAEMVRKD